MDRAKMSNRLMVVTGMLVFFGVACSPQEKEVPEPVLDGKTDVMSEVNYRGRLEYGGEARGEFVNDFQFDAWTFQAPAGARVSVDTTHAGTAASLDNTLFLYGPADDQGKFNGQRIAMDDDSGWGQHARLTDVTVGGKGSYLVVLGTADGQGRGRYRITLTCLSQDCSPEVPEVDGCPGDVEYEFSMCMESAIYEDLQMQQYAMESCLERMLELFDDECEYNSVPADWCALGLERFEAEVIPECVAIMNEEFPPEDLETCDPALLPDLENCTEQKMVDAGMSLEQAIEYCTDESVFHDLASHVCEYDSPDWCRFDFYSVWELMIGDCREKLANLPPLPEAPSATEIEQMTEDAVVSFLSWEDEGYSCEARDFEFAGFDTEKNADGQAIGIFASSIVVGPVNYCAGYTTYQCQTEFRPMNGEWVDMETDCEDIGYD